MNWQIRTAGWALEGTVGDYSLDITGSTSIGLGDSLSKSPFTLLAQEPGPSAARRSQDPGICLSLNVCGIVPRTPEAGQMFWGNINRTSADFRNSLKEITLRQFHYLHVQANRLSRGAVLER
jgi:hypothetical protein